MARTARTAAQPAPAPAKGKGTAPAQPAQPAPAPRKVSAATAAAQDALVAYLQSVAIQPRELARVESRLAGGEPRTVAAVKSLQTWIATEIVGQRTARDLAAHKAVASRKARAAAEAKGETWTAPSKSSLPADHPHRERARKAVASRKARAAAEAKGETWVAPSRSRNTSGEPVDRSDAAQRAWITRRARAAAAAAPTRKGKGKATAPAPAPTRKGTRKSSDAAWQIMRTQTGALHVAPIGGQILCGRKGLAVTPTSIASVVPDGACTVCRTRAARAS